jgi:hypothetical protein
VASLALYLAMMQRDSKARGSEGMSRRVADRCQRSEYREIEAGDVLRAWIHTDGSPSCRVAADVRELTDELRGDSMLA